jgi:3-dehydroquinate dehydratase
MAESQQNYYVLGKPVTKEQYDAATKKMQQESEEFDKKMQSSQSQEEDELNEFAKKAKQRMKGMKAGGKVSSASSRADGIAQRGKTRGRMV